MKWLISTGLLILYNAVLWMLPVERWKRRTAEWIGGLAMLPFLLLLLWVGSGDAFWSLYLLGFLPWQVARINKMPEEKGVDWLWITIGVSVVGFIGYLVAAKHLGWVVPHGLEITW